MTEKTNEELMTEMEERRKRPDSLLTVAELADRKFGHLTSGDFDEWRTDELIEQIFTAGYQAAEAKARIDYGAQYDHGAPVQKIAAEYVKRRGTKEPLSHYEENRFIDGYLAGFHAGSQSK